MGLSSTFFLHLVSMLVDMNVALGERDGHTIGVEGFFDLFGQIEKNPPVVFHLDPGTHHEIHTAVPQFGDRNLWCGSL